MLNCGDGSSIKFSLCLLLLLPPLPFRRCSKGAVLDGAKRQKVIDALAKNVFLVPASQVRGV